MRITFQHSLEDLKERLLVMGGHAEQAIQRAIDAYALCDAEVAEKVYLSENAIDVLEREVDERATEMLAMEQPTAVDLRFILAVLRINVDLERVGDLAANSAQRVQEMAPLARMDLPVDIPRLGSLVAAMIRTALQAFLDGDAELAQSVLEMDGLVDDLNRAAFQSLRNLIAERPDATQQALSSLIIAKNMERIGDHATNIAEDVIFWVLGADVKHMNMAGGRPGAAN